MPEPEQVPLLKTPNVAAVRKRDSYYYYAGKKYPAVTSILSVLAKGDGLVHWAAKTAAALVLSDPERYNTAEMAARGVFDNRDDAAERGKLVHSLAEALGTGAPVDVDALPPHVRGYGRAFVAWTAALRPEPLWVEANVYSTTHQFAGTLDMIARFPDGFVKLVDLKTTKQVFREASLQMTAYAHADFILPRGTNQTPVPMPQVAETAVVLLQPDGTYQHKTVTAPFEVFLAVKACWEWANAN